MAAPARLSELHPIWREALACYESLRRVGFCSDDIFLCRHDDGRMMMFVQSARYGLVVNLAEGDPAELGALPLDELAGEWRAAAQLWNEASADETQELYASSLIRLQSTKMVVDLVSHGITMPATCDA